MPRLVRRSRMGGRRRRHRMRGGALPAWLSKAHSFVKRNKLISRVAGALRSANVPYAGQIGSIATKLGYGRRRHRRGGALRLAGGARIRY